MYCLWKKADPKTIIFSILLSLVSFVPYIPLYKDFGLSLDDLLFLFFIFIGFSFVSFNNFVKVSNNLIFPFLLFISFALISSLYNAQDLNNFLVFSIKGPLKVFLFLVFILLCQNIFRRKREIKILLLVLLLFSFLQGIFSISAFVLKYQGPYRTGTIESQKYSAILGRADRRTVGTFGSWEENFLGSNLLGSYLILFIPLSLYFFCYASKKKNKILFALIFVTQFTSLILTYNRSSFLIVFLGFMLLALLLKKYKFCLLVMGSILLIFFFWPGVYDRFLLDQFDRFIIWRQALLVIMKNFWFGVGRGNYLNELSRRALDYRLWIKTTPHNGFLSIFAELGIGSISSFLIIIYFYSRKIIHSFFCSLRDPLPIFLAVGGIMFIMQNIFNNFFFMTTVAVYFWLFYILLLNLNKMRFKEVRKD